MATCLYGVVSKGSLTFLGFFFFFMQCGVKSLLGTSGIYPATYSRGLFAGLFSDAMGLLFTDCIMWNGKDKTAGFKNYIVST